MRNVRTLAALCAALAALPLAAYDPATFGFALVSSSDGVDLLRHESGLSVEFAPGAALLSGFLHTRKPHISRPLDCH